MKFVETRPNGSKYWTDGGFAALMLLRLLIKLTNYRGNIFGLVK